MIRMNSRPVPPKHGSYNMQLKQKTDIVTYTHLEGNRMHMDEFAIGAIGESRHLVGKNKE